MDQSAGEEKPQLQPREAGPGTDWVTTGIYSLKGVRLLVPPGRLLALRPRPTAATETAAARGTDAGMILFCSFFLYGELIVSRLCS